MESDDTLKIKFYNLFYEWKVLERGSDHRYLLSQDYYLDQRVYLYNFKDSVLDDAVSDLESRISRLREQKIRSGAGRTMGQTSISHLPDVASRSLASRLYGNVVEPVIHPLKTFRNWRDRRKK